METERIRRRKWFWAWQDEREETWLQDMAAQGYHLVDTNCPGVYDFVKGEPSETIYRLDFPYAAGQDLESYLQLFEDAGWEHVGSMGGWQYFRKTVQPGESAEIYTDNESKIRKYQRLVTYLAIFLPIWIVLRPDHLDRYAPWLGITVAILYAALMLGLFAGMLMLFLRIRELKAE